MASPRIPPALALFFGILAVSTASLFIRFAQQDAPSLIIAAYRLGLASLALAVPVLRRQGNEFRRLERRDLLLIALSGVFLAVHFASWITSLEYTTVASSVILVTTTPLWVGLLSPLVLRERLTRALVVGMCLTLAGSVIVGLSDTCTWQSGLQCPSLSTFVQGRAFTGDFLALIGAWMAAGYLLIGRGVREKLSLWSYIFGVYGTAAFTLVLWAALAGLSFTGYRPQTYLWMAALALVPQLMGHSTFNWALRHLPAAYVSVTLLGEPVGSAVLAFLLLGETPGALMLTGAALILIGIAVASRPQPDLPVEEALAEM
ncbi:MAG: DMT family transporter [Anaerolineae bacterium]|nr:MAG: DMT family transporter [Anaerolineae bacterium]